MRSYFRLIGVREGSRGLGQEVNRWREGQCALRYLELVGPYVAARPGHAGGVHHSGQPPLVGGQRNVRGIGAATGIARVDRGAARQERVGHGGDIYGKYLASAKSSVAPMVALPAAMIFPSG